MRKLDPGDEKLYPEIYPDSHTCSKEREEKRENPYFFFHNSRNDKKHKIVERDDDEEYACNFYH
jgi:hypothetical protein